METLDEKNARVQAELARKRFEAMTDRELREWQRINDAPASVKCRAIMRGEWWP